MAKEKNDNEDNLIKCPVIRGRVLGVSVYRGYEQLCTLAEISKADIYDQKSNPRGTQRDLSPKHAKEAYEYVKNKELGFWPELFLCCRNNNALTYIPMSDDFPDVGILEIDRTKLGNNNDVIISRVDGNHRLHFGDGIEKGYFKIERLVSFCIAYDLNRDEEIQLFKDINKNQKPMNTSHLDGIEVRLTAEEELKRRNPDLFIAQKLNSDTSSPLFGKVYEGGKKPVGVDIPLRGLRTGIQYMLSRSTQLPRLTDAEAQYKVIKNFFSSVKLWHPTAWANPKEYIMLRGAGLWGICFLGSQVIDRALMNNKFDAESILSIISSGKSWDWSNKGSFVGLSGRAGALEISNKVARHLKDSNQISTDQLFEQIMSSK